MKSISLTNHGSAIDTVMPDGVMRTFEKLPNGFGAWASALRIDGRDFIILSTTEADLKWFFEERGTGYTTDRFRRAVLSADKRFPLRSPANL